MKKEVILETFAAPNNKPNCILTLSNVTYYKLLAAKVWLKTRRLRLQKIMKRKNEQKRMKHLYKELWSKRAIEDALTTMHSPMLRSLCSGGVSESSAGVRSGKSFAQLNNCVAPVRDHRCDDVTIWGSRTGPLFPP